MERRSPQAVLSAAIFFWACISRAICGVTRAFRFALYCGKGKPPWSQAFTQNLHFVTHTVNKCTRRQPVAQNISTVNRIAKIAMATPGGQRRLTPPDTRIQSLRIGLCADCSFFPALPISEQCTVSRSPRCFSYLVFRAFFLFQYFLYDETFDAFA